MGGILGIITIFIDGDTDDGDDVFRAANNAKSFFTPSQNKRIRSMIRIIPGIGFTTVVLSR